MDRTGAGISVVHALYDLGPAEPHLHHLQNGPNGPEEPMGDSQEIMDLLCPLQCLAHRRSFRKE